MLMFHKNKRREGKKPPSSVSLNTKLSAVGNMPVTLTSDRGQNHFPARGKESVLGKNVSLARN